MAGSAPGDRRNQGTPAPFIGDVNFTIVQEQLGRWVMPHDKKNSMETAHYIAEMLLELRNLAKAADLKKLQDLLEMACYEAFSAAQGNIIPEGEAEQLERLEKMAAEAEKMAKR